MVGRTVKARLAAVARSSLPHAVLGAFTDVASLCRTFTIACVDARPGLPEEEQNCDVDVVRFERVAGVPEPRFFEAMRDAFKAIVRDADADGGGACHRYLFDGRCSSDVNVMVNLVNTVEHSF